MPKKLIGLDGKQIFADETDSSGSGAALQNYWKHTTYLNPPDVSVSPDCPDVGMSPDCRPNPPTF